MDDHDAGLREAYIRAAALPGPSADQVNAMQQAVERDRAEAHARPSSRWPQVIVVAALVGAAILAAVVARQSTVSSQAAEPTPYLSIAPD